MNTPTEQKPSDALMDDIKYLLACAEHHADKFPVPAHMRELCDRIRHRLDHSAAPASGELVEAIRSYFVERTGFTTVDSEGDVSAFYGGHWHTLSPAKIAEVALRARDAEVAAWLREGAAAYTGHNLVEFGNAYTEIADAIEAGAIGRG